MARELERLQREEAAAAAAKKARAAALMEEVRTERPGIGTTNAAVLRQQQ
jgi:hypothetical protein